MRRQEVMDKLAANRAELRRMGVRSLSLFGSLARDEATDRSDVDFLVEFDRPIGLFHFIRVQQYLQEVLGVPRVDLVMPEALQEELRDDILRDAIRAA
ncbi:MAG: nucleotidyltransferase family protein [Planctomycetes bacterium]|nr:nucleotidyltransferase family protein [Planctomycetota bacterium]